MEANRFTGKFIPDTKIPHVEEVDMGNGIKQLIIRYADEDIVEKPRELHIIPFLPREHIIDMQPIKKKSALPLHDIAVVAGTSAPIIFTLIFADFLVGTKVFAPLGVASVLWFWFVFLVNTKWRREE